VSQDIRSWDILNVTNYEGFADGSPFEDKYNPFTKIIDDGNTKLIDKNFKIDINKIKNYDSSASIEEQYLTVINYLRSLKVKCHDENAFEGPVGSDLIWNVLLEDSSKEHSDDMSLNKIFTHDGTGKTSDITGQSFNPPRKSDPFERMKAHGYNYLSAGENIAYSEGTTFAIGDSISDPLSDKAWIDAMEGWMKSETGHCSNIMNPDFIEFGMAETRDVKKFYDKNIGEWLIESTAFWTQNFGRSR